MTQKVSKNTAKHLTKSSSKTPAKIGRPSGYQLGFAQAAYEACLAGATDELLAEQFGIAVSTIYVWKKNFPEFSEAIKRGKHPANNTIASALFERAKGFEYDKEVPIKLKEVIYENGKRVKETERVEMVMVHEVVPPDTTAGIFWMKNRRPDAWRDKHEYNHNITDLTSLPDAELEKRRKALGLA